MQNDLKNDTVAQIKQFKTKSVVYLLFNVRPVSVGNERGIPQGRIQGPVLFTNTSCFIQPCKYHPHGNNTQ